MGNEWAGWLCASPSTFTVSPGAPQRLAVGAVVALPWLGWEICIR
jgi:hypothetical protein